MRSKFLSIEHQSTDLDLFFWEIAVGTHNAFLIVLNVIPRKSGKPLLPFLHLTLNTYQAMICRPATWAFTRNATFLKLTQSNSCLLMLVKRVFSHRK